MKLRLRTLASMSFGSTTEATCTSVELANSHHRGMSLSTGAIGLQSMGPFRRVNFPVGGLALYMVALVHGCVWDMHRQNPPGQTLSAMTPPVGISENPMFPRTQARLRRVGGPRFRVSRNQVDLGAHYDAASVSAAFEVSNEGSADLTMQVNENSCACIRAEALASRVPPGGKGKIEITLRLQASEGERSDPVRIRTNDPDQPEVTLTVKSVVFKNNAAIEPPGLLWGDLERGRGAEREVTVTQRGPEPLAIKKLQTTADWVEASVTETRSGSAGASPSQNNAFRNTNELAGMEQTVPGAKDSPSRQYQVRVALDTAKAPMGRFYEYITIYTESERFPVLEIPMKGRIVDSTSQSQTTDTRVEAQKTHFGSRQAP